VLCRGPGCCEPHGDDKGAGGGSPRRHLLRQWRVLQVLEATSDTDQRGSGVVRAIVVGGGRVSCGKALEHSHQCRANGLKR